MTSKSKVWLCSLAVAVLLLQACGGKNTKPDEAQAEAVSGESSLPTPNKDILVTDGDLSKKYTILGQVEFKSNNSSIYADNVEGTKAARDSLKKVAYSKYGDKVDAIINTKVQTATNGGFWKMMGAAYGAPVLTIFAEGIAVSYAENTMEPAPTSKPAVEATPKAVVSKSKRKSRKGH